MKKILISCMVLIFSITAYADELIYEENNEMLHSVYLDLGGFFHNKDTLKKNLNVNDLDRGGVFGLAAIFRFIEYAGIEPFISSQNSSKTKNNDDYDYSNTRLGLNGHLVYPVGKFKFYGFGGIAYNFVSLTRDSTSTKYTYDIDNCLGMQAGVGFDYNYHRFLFGAKYEYFTNKPKAKYVTGEKKEIDLSGNAITVRVGFIF